MGKILTLPIARIDGSGLSAASEDVTHGRLPWRVVDNGTEGVILDAYGRPLLHGLPGACRRATDAANSFLALYGEFERMAEAMRAAHAAMRRQPNRTSALDAAYRLIDELLDPEEPAL
ncbi:MAG TPA: hypothetical protein VNQ99_06250 [Xanthobacteraceae bacterium]|nr:hypothetical protein [Xanthobacteraceae bacterium]